MNKFKFDIIGKTKVWFILSLCIIIPGIVSMATQGFNFGIDFTGGTIIEMRYDDSVTIGKIREIAVLKLIGTRDRTIAGMILQQALGLGIIGFIVGKTVATAWAPIFPKYVLLEPGDAVRGFFLVMLICTVASTLAIRAALKADPAAAIGG